MSIRLNVWQRLFVLIGAIWLAVPVTYLWDSYPRTGKYVEDMIQLEVMSRSPCSYSVTPSKDCVSVRKLDEHELAEIRRRVETRALQELPAVRMTVVEVAAALWLLPLAAVYLIGLAVARVRRKFPHS